MENHATLFAAIIAAILAIIGYFLKKMDKKLDKVDEIAVHIAKMDTQQGTQTADLHSVKKEVAEIRSDVYKINSRLTVIEHDHENFHNQNRYHEKNKKGQA